MYSTYIGVLEYKPCDECEGERGAGRKGVPCPAWVAFEEIYVHSEETLWEFVSDGNIMVVN